MSNTIAFFQTVILVGLTVAALVVELWAFIDALRRPAAAFVTAGKRTKNFWLLITGIAAAIGLVSVPPLSAFGIGLVTLIALIGSAVYLVDVRPAVKQYSGRRDDGPRSRGW